MGGNPSSKWPRTKSMKESIIMAILGGSLIGMSASLLLLVSGRIAGISGIIGGLLKHQASSIPWRVTFLSGLMFGGWSLMTVMPLSIQGPEGRSVLMIAVAGVLVGIGTQLGNGCTSGHGVCGITRMSPRSIVATLTFMATGALTATAMGLFGGVAP